MSNITILGSGRVASGLAVKLSAAGHGVTIGSRSAKAEVPDWVSPAIYVAEPCAAVREADIVINATPGESSLQRLGALSSELAGKILVDVSNAVERGADGLPGRLSYPNSSLAEKLQEALPDTRVVKTLNTMLFSVMTNPASLMSPPTAFVSGNDADAKATVTALLGDLGWAPEQVLDLGDVRTARGPEAMVLFVPDLITARGFAPFAVTIAS